MSIMILQIKLLTLNCSNTATTLNPLRIQINTTNLLISSLTTDCITTR